MYRVIIYPLFISADNTPYEKIGNNEPVSIADEVPFEIPESWEWVRFSTIIELQSGQDMTPEKYNSEGKGIPYITGASNIDSGRVIVNRWTEYPKAFAYMGDLLLTCKGTVGTMAFLTEPEAHIARQIMAIRAFPLINIHYIQIVLSSLVAELKAAAKSMIPGISRDDVLKALLPLPPRAEQDRIVKSFEKLADPLYSYNELYIDLKTLNEGFPEKLKKSILQMAVQGKLVEQDPNVEPASALLERIRAEKERLIAEGRIKRDKNESVIFRRDNSHYEKLNEKERCIDDEIPFEIPESWNWCYIGNIAFVTKLAGFEYTKYIAPNLQPAGIPLFKGKNVQSGKIVYDFEGFIGEELSNVSGKLNSAEFGK